MRPGARFGLARKRSRDARRPTWLQLLLPLFDPQPPPWLARPAASSTSVAAASHGDDASGALAMAWDRGAPSWSRTWGVPDLRDTVRVELSHRMRSSLGGFYPQERLIRIADTLLEAPAHLLDEVLCHEAAHATVHVLHGDRARSHGREWRHLMRAVGMEPRVRIPREELKLAAQRAARKRWVWRHRCPTCRAERFAGRPVRQWRCGRCRSAGHDGRLVITRIAARATRALP
jgi:predicted SprT family Zn-dependent metalloprotease